MSGVKYNLDTLNRDSFVAKKAAGDFPFGQVPVLTLKDGGWARTCFEVRMFAYW